MGTMGSCWNVDEYPSLFLLCGHWIVSLTTSCQSIFCLKNTYHYSFIHSLIAVLFKEATSLADSSGHAVNV